jgi:hypothetical protein
LQGDLGSKAVKQLLATWADVAVPQIVLINFKAFVEKYRQTLIFSVKNTDNSF